MANTRGVRAIPDRGYNFELMVAGTDYHTRPFSKVVRDSSGVKSTKTVNLRIQAIYVSSAGGIKLISGAGAMDSPVTGVDIPGLLAGAIYPFCPQQIAAPDAGSTAVVYAIYGK